MKTGNLFIYLASKRWQPLKDKALLSVTCNAVITLNCSVFIVPQNSQRTSTTQQKRVRNQY